MHMLQCYKEYIDQMVDVTSPENAFYMEGSLLCQFVVILFFDLLYRRDFRLSRAYNQSSLYRQCLYSIFDVNQICSADRFPFSYEYSKIYWKLVMSSCAVTQSNPLF